MEDRGKGWGYYSLGLSGYEVKVNPDAESVTWVYVGSVREQTTHKAKIYYEGERQYFNATGRKIYLDECLRSDIGCTS